MELRSYRAPIHWYYWAPWRIPCYVAEKDNDLRQDLFSWCNSQHISWEFRNGEFGFEREQDMLAFLMAWG